MFKNKCKRVLSLILTIMCIASVISFPTSSVSADMGIPAPISAEGHKKGAYNNNGLTYDIVNNEAVIMYSPVAGNIVIPDQIEGYPVTQIADYAFDECDDIKTVIIGNKVKRVGNHSFYFCKRLTKVTVGSSVLEIGESAFQYNMLLEEISLPDTIIKIGTFAFDDTEYYKNAKNWDSTKSIVYVGKYLLAVKTTVKGDFAIKSGTLGIADCALSNCTAITSVSIPGSVRSIGSAAFDNCNGLKKVIIPDSVKYIHGYAFQGCTALSDITIGKGVERVGSFAFDNTGYSKKTANWSNNILYIGNWLMDVKEGNAVGAINIKAGTVGIADWAFHNCTAITSVTLPDGLKYVGVSAFNNCSKLAKVSLSSSVKYMGENAFVFSKPADIYISDIGAWCGIHFENIDANPLRKAKNVYVNNARVTQIEVPGTVTSIGQYAFANFTTLNLVTIPNSVKSIGKDCFYNCGKVKIRCNANSYAYRYAQDNNISVVSLCSHLFDVYVSNNNATCTEDATKTAVCKLGCGMSNTIPDPGTKLGHTFTKYISDNNATCKSDGTMSAYCDRGCGGKDVIPEPGTRRSHSYGEYVYDDNATCMADGTESSYCIYGCGLFQRRVAEGTVTDHRYSNYIPNGDATCYEDGTKTAVCDFGCGNSVTIEDIGSGRHHFSPWQVIIMPTADSKGRTDRICASCSETETRTIDKIAFADVKNSHWYADAVIYSVINSYMKGMSDTKFSPNSNITREQFVLILANIAGINTDEYKNIDSGFTDVKTGQWYSGAVTWAAQEGYVSGVSATKFGRGQSIQRAALARMLYNYASKNDIDIDGRADLSGFGDAKEFDKSGNAWMVEPVKWAVSCGIISGMNINGVNCVNPKGTATRAQASVMLMKFDTVR